MPFLAEQQYDIPNKDILSWEFDDLHYNPDEPILIDALKPSNNISARKAQKAIRQLVAGFRAIGVQKGDAVCIHSVNNIWYPIFFQGIVGTGGVFAGTNPAYTPYELAHTLRTAKVKFVLVQPELLKPMLAATKEAGIPNERVIIFNLNGETAPEGFLQWPDLFEHGERDWVRFDDRQIAESTTAALLFSSGTTGLPKAAELSHRNFVAQHTLVFEADTRPWRASRLMCLPMFHVATVPVAHTTPFRAGHIHYVLPRFDIESWFWAMDKYAITDCTMVPPIVVLAVNSPANKKYSLKAVREAKVGAAPLDAALQARMQALLPGNASMSQVWGMSETSCIASRLLHFEMDTTASVGRMLPSIDVKLVDDDGNDISSYDVRGELCIRGPTVIKGYFENPEANKRDFDAEGFFHTGDIAYLDGKSKLWYIVDRKKELIKVRGFQVAPPEIEGLLLDHPSIVDCGVIGVAHSGAAGGSSEGSEAPRAYVVKRPGVGDKLTEKQVYDFVAGKLVYYKKLDGGVVFVDAIPKNASGKILKRVLREQAKKEMGSKL
ncbi:hypothetical protein MBLNU230_g8066t1 [Neophaeotheca triangularis]